MTTYPTDETYSHSQEIDCPHCGKQLTSELFEYEDAEEEIECPHCDKIIVVEAEVGLTYTAMVKE